MDPHNHEPPSASDLAALLRAAADGELSPEQKRALDAHLAAHPEDAARIEFERALRGACARAMDVPAPAGLRARLEQRLAGAGDLAESVAGRIGPEGIVTIGRRRRVLMSMAAGLLLLVAGFSLFQSLTGSGWGIPGYHAAGFHGKLAQFASREHFRCWLDKSRAARKFVIGSRDEFTKACQSKLGVAPELPAEEAEALQFVGAGYCALPGRGPSMHVSFHATGAEVTLIPVSLFLKQDNGEFDAEAGKVFILHAQDEDQNPCTIFGWRQDGLVYLLVSQSPECAAHLRVALGVPEPAGDLR